MFGMKINLVKYLDKTGQLQKIEESAVKYKNECINNNFTNNYVPPLKISVELDYMLLVEIAGDFATLLTEEPNVAKEGLSDLIQTSCSILAEYENIPVYLLVRIISFPKLLTTSQNKNIHPGGLFTKIGVLAEISQVEKYTQDVSFVCNYSNCYEKRNIFKKYGKCQYCGKELKEIARSRMTGDKVIGLLLDTDFLQPFNSYARTQGIAIEFRDEVFIALEIGVIYNVALTLERGVYLAWGVQPMLPDPLVRLFTNINPPPLPSAVSQLIATIRRGTHGSPWSVVTALASVIPGNSYPLSAFLHLKTALLLSLASICSKSPVPILALGDCGTLMVDAWYCSPRAIFSPAGPVSLLIASYGVCLVHENNHGLSSYITTAVESELVTIAHTKSPKDKKYTTHSLKAAVWMYWHCNKNSGQDMHKLRTLIDVFGIPFLDTIDVDDEKVSEHILQKTIDNSINLDLIPQKDFRKFIDIISGLNVTMSDMASTLIKNYFVASRRERPECLPLKAIKVLTSLSESHARLSFRETVTYEDAVAAIFLYEESINVLFGASLCSEMPKRTITADSPIEIAMQMDTILGKFSQWLQSYLRTQSSTISENSFDQSTSSPPHF